MPTNFDELLERAQWGEISPDEAARVARELEASDSEADRYTLLLILGNAGAVAHRETVERFLSSEDDPMLARVSLQVLCQFWGDTERYLDRVHEFVRGVPWDAGDDVRLMAISVSAGRLRDNRDTRLLQELVSIFENENERRIVREAAYLALARSVGEPWERLPSAARHFDLDKEVDHSVIRRVKERVSKELNSEP